VPKVNPDDYKLAGKWANHVRALVEGDEDPSGEIDPAGHNDGGRAFGPLQQHPAFFLQYYGEQGFNPELTDTWVQAQIKAAAAFLEEHSRDFPLELVIQAYNQGCHAVFGAGVRAPAYLAKWKAAYARLTGSNTLMRFPQN
jgi:hypothetical protein